jgi:hypothetical protein
MGRWSMIGVALLFVIILGAGYWLFLFDPYVDAGEAGVFRNNCCGTVELSGGDMLLNGRKSVRYVVERDAEGPYVLPRYYVGAFPYNRFEVVGAARVVKLRLDKLPTPTRITLYQAQTAYDFQRQSVPRR